VYKNKKDLADAAMPASAKVLLTTVYIRCQQSRELESFRIDDFVVQLLPFFQ